MRTYVLWLVHLSMDHPSIHQIVCICSITPLIPILYYLLNSVNWLVIDSESAPEAKYQCPKCQCTNPLTFSPDDGSPNLSVSYTLRNILQSQCGTDKYQQRLDLTAEDRSSWKQKLVAIGCDIQQQHRDKYKWFGIPRLFQNVMYLMTRYHHDVPHDVWYSVVELLFIIEMMIISSLLLGLCWAYWTMPFNPRIDCGHFLFVFVSQSIFERLIFLWFSDFL